MFMSHKMCQREPIDVQLVHNQGGLPGAALPSWSSLLNLASNDARRPFI